MATRVKKKTFVNVTLEQAQEASSSFATTNNKLAKLEAKMNEEINKIKSKYQDEVNDLTEAMEEPKSILEVFAREQQDSWGKKKSYELLHTTIGFRTGMPKLKCDKGFTWPAVTALVEEFYPDYVRKVTELNKEKLIGDRESEVFEKISKKVHISVIQDETFYVEAKEEVVA